MAQGFTIVDAEVGWRPVHPKDWEIVRIAYDLEPGFTRRLDVTLQRGRDGEIAHVSISGATSFRVQHERDMGDYWRQMEAEAVGAGTFFTVRQSAYLDDLSGGVSAHRQQTHYVLVTGEDCVEFIGPAWAKEFRIQIEMPPQ